jgi:hypothetical protein
MLAGHNMLDGARYGIDHSLYSKQDARLLRELLTRTGCFVFENFAWRHDQYDFSIELFICNCVTIVVR